MPSLTPNQKFQDSYYMLQAIELAKKGLYTTRPNPKVGCVIVNNNQIIGQGFHYQAGQPHAEVFALREARDKYPEQLIGATAYVTLEPCSHYGRTPPCADALIEAGIARVVIAVTDPNPKVAGGGIKKLQEAGIEVITNVCHDKAYSLNAGFFRTMAGGLPYIRLKSAMSIDGKIAMENGESKWITSEASREDVQQLRALSGAIITGSQTVLSDNPSLTVRSSKLGIPVADIPQPLLVVLDRRSRISSNSDWYQHQIKQRPVLLIQETSLDLTALLIQLRDEFNIQDILVEAGAGITTVFLESGLVDEWIIYQAPCLMGDKAKSVSDLSLAHMCQQVRFSIVSHETIDSDLKLIFKPA